MTNRGLCREVELGDEEPTEIILKPRRARESHEIFEIIERIRGGAAIRSSITLLRANEETPKLNLD